MRVGTRRLPHEGGSLTVPAGPVTERVPPSRSTGRLPLSHALLALAVVAVWGTNFVVIKVALDHMPPLLLAVLRFAFALLPAALFVARPQVAWRKLAGYGVAIGAGQFGLLYIAINGHISPGLASLVVQIQVFFTIGLAMRFDGEKVRPFQWVALALATAGIVVIAANTHGKAGADATLLGLGLAVLGAFAWATGNQISRTMGRVHMLGVVVWSSAFALPVLLVLSLWFEGPARVGTALTTASAPVWAAVVWQAVGNTLFGYAAWGWLLARHPAATVVPMALLVPVFGMSAASLLLGESLPGWKLLAAALVLGGLALNLLWPRKAT
jgi:O-acetylserine/cysteine efflux transporter